MEGRLLDRARGGDRSAFDALYAAHAPTGWRLAYALTGEADDATEALTTGAARAFGPTSSPFLPGPAEVELCHRVRGVAGDLRPRAADAPAYEAPDPGVADVAEAFAALPERSRVALWLHHVEGFADADVATVLEVPDEFLTSLLERSEAGMRQHYVDDHVAVHGGRNCDRAIARLCAHAAGSLPEDEVVLVERHLGLCATCDDRATGLASLFASLPRIVPPMPDLTNQIAGAWLLAVTPSATGTGISAMGEKVIAGVSAAAAAVAVVGAALAAGHDRSGSGDVVPTEAVVADLSNDAADGSGSSAGLDPAGGRISFDGSDRAPDLDQRRIGSGTRSAGGSTSQVESSTLVPEDDSTVASTTDGSGGSVSTPTAPAPPSVPAEDDPAGELEDPVGDEPLVSVGTTLGDVPVAVEVGSEPGVTVGPISLGSEPEPDDELVRVGTLGL